jgi:predicted ferric reductase
MSSSETGAFAVGAGRAAGRARHRSRGRAARTAAAAMWWALLLGNAAVIVYLWIHGGGIAKTDTADVLASLGRLTGLLGAYLALIQVLLLARIPPLEQLVGLDRLSVWHRWNGHACVDLVIAHVVLIVPAYALMDRLSIAGESWNMLAGGVYPGMITATVGTVLLIAVAASSVVIARRRLRYETWYAVHLTAYAAIALGWFHQIPTGNELVLDEVAADWWRALYVATLALLVGYRIVRPAVQAARHRLRVTEVVEEGPGVVSVRMAGRGLDRLRARSGQFFLWRFLTRDGWWKSHPFSLSEAPDGRSLRITVKDLGDFTGRVREIPVGTRVVAEGPFGVFTEDAAREQKALLIGGGIGITPIRSLVERMDGDLVVAYRVLREEDVIFRDELAALAGKRGFALHVLAADHATPEGARLLGPDHLRELVPDLAERDVYVCGPPAMADAVARDVRRAGVPRRRLHTERFAL